MIHPEVSKEINKEAFRLLEQYPNMKRKRAFDLASQLMRTLCDANTKLFYAENITITR